jgi:hypothetical protein
MMFRGEQGTTECIYNEGEEGRRRERGAERRNVTSLDNNVLEVCSLEIGTPQVSVLEITAA